TGPTARPTGPTARPWVTAPSSGPTPISSGRPGHDRRRSSTHAPPVPARARPAVLPGAQAQRHGLDTPARPRPVLADDVSQGDGTSAPVVPAGRYRPDGGSAGLRRPGHRHRGLD